MDYTAYGESVGTGTGLRTVQQGFGSNDPIRQRYGLTERDDATGLDHTWFRKHENRAGRWTSPDPYNGSMSLGDPQSFNRYSYVIAQPTNYVDPTGLLIASVCKWVFYSSVTEYDEDGNPVSYDPGGWVYECTHIFISSTSSGFVPAHGDPGGGGSSSRDLTRLNRDLGICNLASGAEYFYQQGDYWKGANGKWYKGLSGRGPNQYTGPRSSALGPAKAFRVLGRVTFVAGAGISVYQVAFGEVSPGKAFADVAFGFIAAFGGPVGFAIGATYFLVDQTIGWDKVLEGLKQNPRTINTNICHTNQ